MAANLTSLSSALVTSPRQCAHPSQNGVSVGGKDTLCHLCSAMPLDSKGLAELVKATVAEIGRRGNYCKGVPIGTRILEDLKPETCPLCRVFEEAWILAGGSGLIFTVEAETFIGSQENVWAPSVALKLSCHTDTKRNIGDARVVVTSNRTEDDFPAAIPFTNCTECLNYVDWNTVKGYFATCISQHLSDCRKHGQGKLRSLEIQLIDCETRQIGPAPANCKYAALSYVWGSSSDTPQFASQLPAPGLMPLLVEDAMKCTRELGLKYLWIDRYCIDQHDATTKYATIQRMDQIYRQSAITIINAARSGADCGLAGVSTVPLRKHCVASIDGRIFSAFPDIRAEVLSSAWSSRGWTYQEGLLARRRLIFTKSRVHFECLDMKACWPIQLQNDASNRWGWHGENDKSDMFGMMHAFPFFQHDDSHIHDRLEEYFGRTLTHSTDILNAFMGILRQAWLLRVPTYHFWGLPFLPASSLESSLLEALFWLSYDGSGSQLLSRRNGLPSWTWAGWQGLRRIEWASDMPGLHPETLRDRKQLYRLTDMAHDLKLIIHHQSGDRVTLAEYVMRMGTTWNMFEFQPHINITGWTTNVRIFNRAQRHSLLRRLPLLRGPDRYERDLANTTLGNKHGRVYGHAQVLDGSEPEVITSPGVIPIPTLCHAMLFVNANDYLIGRGLLLKRMPDGSFEKMGVIFDILGWLTKDTENQNHATVSLKGMDKINIAALELECELRTIKLV
ncbi:heterokaryon incompatibility protein-domain-containing protein [Paraphoma chrysanthemicola]|uniref:Heterokaryon incompatibility protein-domain-containing protein n=1 Tax=Paraphoma chrysanthemicola TaxID=798071 RepID=A0A8K0R551_9PLEO|nr:heterokaryon incompatibility protein-domain-containing protein [Paraphoma chrysanthemicola]